MQRQSVKVRLDQHLVDLGLAPSRSRARDLITRGAVLVEGQPASKPGQLVFPDMPVALEEAARGSTHHVSRGALKLAAALEHFAIVPSGAVALDIGASTGGFTQILLERGAARVYAVDVGRDQLAPLLRSDPRVHVLEQQDARQLTRREVPEPVTLIVADVSFISLTQVLRAPLTLASSGARLIALVKPQFEAGRAALGKGGIVRAAEDRQAALARVASWIADQPGWRVIGSMPSPITGKDGNVEQLLAAERADGGAGAGTHG